MERARLVRDVCGEMGVPFVLNDRPDLALQVGADGVHVGQDDARPGLARRIMGPDAIVGLSTHAPDELDAAEAEPVDYISVGPVVPTPTKPGRPGTGLEYVAYAAARCTRPFYVTGGVNPATVTSVLGAGAHGVVVVRALTESGDPGAVAGAIKSQFSR